MTATAVISKSYNNQESYSPWGQGLQHKIISNLIDPTFLELNTLKQPHNKYSSQYSQIAPSFTQMDLIERAFRSTHPVAINYHLHEISSAFSICDNSVIAIESIQKQPNGAIEFIFYFAQGKTGIVKISEQLRPEAIKHLAAFKKPSPLRLNYSETIKSLRDYQRDSNISAPDLMDTILSRFIMSFDLIIDLSNCAIYKRNYDIVLESILEQNYHMDSVVVFDEALLKRCANDFIAMHNQNLNTIPELQKIHLHLRADKPPKLMRAVKQNSDKTSMVKVDYATPHKLMMLLASNSSIALNMLIDMEKLSQLSKDPAADLSSCVVEYEKRIRNGKLKRKYLACASERVTGPSYYMLND